MSQVDACVFQVYSYGYARRALMPCNVAETPQLAYQVAILLHIMPLIFLQKNE